MIPILEKPTLEVLFFHIKDGKCELKELKQMNFGEIKFKTLWIIDFFDNGFNLRIKDYSSFCTNSCLSEAV